MQLAECFAIQTNLGVIILDICGSGSGRAGDSHDIPAHIVYARVDNIASADDFLKIGRASCRERVWRYV